MTVRINPYSGVDWNAVTHVPGNTHMHITNQESFDNYYNSGVRAMSASRYYPERPITLADLTTGVPAGAFLIPNSEQHSCTDNALHFGPVGSTYSNDGGTGVPWRDAFNAAIAQLVDPLGGGIVLNHPQWSGSLTQPVINAMLDHAPGVLGVEVYNHAIVSAVREPGDNRGLPAYPYWDRALASGRRCWGFWGHDHYLPESAPYKGFNMLLIPELTSQAALRAYRDGRFYGSLTQQLRLTGMTVADRIVTVTTNAATTLRMVTDVGSLDVSGSSHTFIVPEMAGYARFEGEGSGDILYTQPVMYETRRVDRKSQRRRAVVLT